MTVPNNGPSKDWMCQLNKSLYGLRQAPYLWQSKLREKVAKFGFKPLLLDPSVYCNPIQGVYLVTHVDDFLLIGPPSGVYSLRLNLESAFKMIYLGPADFCVSVRIVRDGVLCTLPIHQDAYINNIVTKFGFQNCSPVSTPLLSGQHLISNNDTATQSDIYLYRSMVGSAMYVATKTRSDIAYL